MLTLKTVSGHRARSLFFFGGVFALAMASCLAPAEENGNGNGEQERTASPDEQALASIQQQPHKRVCADAAPGFKACHARVRTEADGQTIKTFATPSGLTPAQLQSAYNIPSGGTGTVAIVDAQDNPNAESDLAVYRSQFGLPACTTANGCFKKVNQNGAASPLPTGDTGWGGEIALDLDMVSAACPNCKIILVEANSASNADLGAAVNTAAKLGAQAISNSYGGSEDSTTTSDDANYYNHPGILITASAGDSDYGAEFPATGSNVLAVGGTSLTTSTSPRGWAEGVWYTNSTEGTGSGCSKYVAKPSFQSFISTTVCGKRAEADVSAVADPNTGVAVYDTYGGSSAGASGWEVYGGTSAASPLVAAIMVATGKASSATNGFPYANASAFYDVTSGSNGTCSQKVLCNAGAGWDGPTGMGTPNGAAIKAAGSSSSSSSSSSGTTSSSSSSSSSGTTSSGGFGTCSHSECSTGTKLKSGCDSCATQVCGVDPYCCNTKWDSICVGEAGSVCGETCN